MVYIARRFENTGINIEDLISIGTIGLIKAVGTYQPAKKIKLATYASRCIENEILMHLRKTAGQKSEVPFDEPLSTDWNGNELLLSDVLGTDSDLVVRPMEEDADRQVLAQALATLNDREREIITLRFGLGGPPGAHPEGGGGPDGHLPVLHLPAGKADHWEAEEGDLEGDGGAVIGPCTAKQKGTCASAHVPWSVGWKRETGQTDSKVSTISLLGARWPGRPPR